MPTSANLVSRWRPVLIGGVVAAAMLIVAYGLWPRQSPSPATTGITVVDGAAVVPQVASRVARTDPARQPDEVTSSFMRMSLMERQMLIRSHPTDERASTALKTALVAQTAQVTRRLSIDSVRCIDGLCEIGGRLTPSVGRTQDQEVAFLTGGTLSSLLERAGLRSVTETSVNADEQGVLIFTLHGARTV